MPDHPTIRVRFIEADTGQLLGETELPAEQLPQSFEAATSLDIGEGSYEVVSADPMTAREFRQTGTLRLELREVKYAMVDPRELLYSLPTISNELPSIEEGSTKLGKFVLELREDDWRQVELMALSLQPAISTVFAAIERIYTEHRKDSGFGELHVRNEVPAPLEGTSITLADLRGAVGETATWLDGVSFQGVAGLVEGSFAVGLPSGPALYGLQSAGRISVLGLHHTRVIAAVEGDARLLAALASKHQLCLVDWCRVEQLPASTERIQDWLSGQD